MSPKNAIIILIIMAVLGALFFVYLYYNQQLVINPFNRGINLSNQEDITGPTEKLAEPAKDLTPAERKKEIINNLNELRSTKINNASFESFEESKTEEEKKQEIINKLEQLRKSEDQVNQENLEEPAMESQPLIK